MPFDRDGRTDFEWQHEHERRPVPLCQCATESKQCCCSRYGPDHCEYAVAEAVIREVNSYRSANGQSGESARESVCEATEVAAVRTTAAAGPSDEESSSQTQPRSGEATADTTNGETKCAHFISCDRWRSEHMAGVLSARKRCKQKCRGGGHHQYVGSAQYVLARVR
jgi:hypothetical protein